MAASMEAHGLTVQGAAIRRMKELASGGADRRDVVALARELDVLLGEATGRAGSDPVQPTEAS